MNATPMSINAVNAAVPSPAAGKQDAMPPEVPFSQVLSSEMAQNRRDSHAAKEGAEAAADADAEATSPAGRPADDAANAGAAVVDSAESPADPLALPLADNPAAARDPLIALGIPSYPLKPAPATPGEAVVEDAPAQAASALPLQDARKDKAPLAAQAETAGQAIDTPRGASKADPALLSGRVEGNADKTAAATAFAGQLAAARQAEAVKTREFVSELVSNPALRPTVQAPLPPLPAGSDIAAPHLSPAVGTPAWNQALGDKIVWMAAGAQLRPARSSPGAGSGLPAAAGNDERSRHPVGAGVGERRHPAAEQHAGSSAATDRGPLPWCRRVGRRWGASAPCACPDGGPRAGRHLRLTRSVPVSKEMGPFSPSFCGIKGARFFQ